MKEVIDLLFEKGIDYRVLFSPRGTIVHAEELAIDICERPHVGKVFELNANLGGEIFHSSSADFSEVKRFINRAISIYKT